MKNAITLGKLMPLLLSSLPHLVLLSVNVHTTNTRYELTHLVMGTIFLVNKYIYQPAGISISMVLISVGLALLAQLTSESW